MTADVISLDARRAVRGEAARPTSLPASASFRLLRLALAAWWGRSWFAAELREQRVLITWLVAVLAVAVALGCIEQLQNLAPIAGAEVAGRG